MLRACLGLKSLCSWSCKKSTIEKDIAKVSSVWREGKVNQC